MPIFKAPHDRSEALTRLDNLLVEIFTIERQLGDRKDRRNYREWRSRALYALAIKRTERTHLKRWLESQI